MTAVIRISPQRHSALVGHLLPIGSDLEQAAFLFARCVKGSKHFDLEVIESLFLDTEDFEYQAPDYLELSDDTRSRIIKRAHDLNASIVEMHSHPGPYPAAFSASDLRGFSETVPNIFWRLKNAPYAAIVVSETGFDALVWSVDARTPHALEYIDLGKKKIKPTNLTLSRVG
jgi:hypothetical protein